MPTDDRKEVLSLYLKNFDCDSSSFELYVEVNGLDIERLKGEKD